MSLLALLGIHITKPEEHESKNRDMPLEIRRFPDDGSGFYIAKMEKIEHPTIYSMCSSHT